MGHGDAVLGHERVVVGDPQLRRVEVGTPGGPAELVAPPAIVSDRSESLGPVPAPGEHNDLIRREFSNREREDG